MQYRITVCEGAGSDAEALNALSDFSRRAGLAGYLSELDTAFLWDSLKKSAEARLSLLQSEEDRFRISSIIKPFFDAVTAGEMATALSIARLSPKVWSENEEYEDDFYYSQFLFSLIAEPENRDGHQELLKKFKETASGTEDERADICTALVEDNGQNFYEGMSCFLENWEQGYGERIKNNASLSEEFYTERFISTEGLAIMRIGQLYCNFEPMEFALLPLSALKPISNQGV